MNGNFEMQIPDGKTIITISYIGFNSVDFNTSKLKTAVIVLKSDSENLEEVVVTALGIKEKKSLWPHSELNSDEVSSREPNLLNGISGKVGFTK
jgi:acyl-CoA hydrolase